MDWTTPSLATLLACIWERLETGAAHREDPWHLAGLATVDAGQPAVRTVVLRAADAQRRALVFYSDARANKILQLHNHPKVEWLFYDPVERIQLRAHAQATVHHQNAVAEEIWRARPDLNYLRYLSPLAPGTGLPAYLPPQVEVLPEDELAFRNFAVVITTVERFDWLALFPDDSHKRAAFSWNGEDFDARWVVP